MMASFHGHRDSDSEELRKNEYGFHAPAARRRFRMATALMK